MYFLFPARYLDDHSGHSTPSSTISNWLFSGSQAPFPQAGGGHGHQESPQSVSPAAFASTSPTPFDDVGGGRNSGGPHSLLGFSSADMGAASGINFPDPSGGLNNLNKMGGSVSFMPPSSMPGMAPSSTPGMAQEADLFSPRLHQSPSCLLYTSPSPRD